MHIAREIASWWNTLPWGTIGAVVGTMYFLMVVGMGVKWMLPRGFIRRFGRFLKTSNGVLFLAMAAVATVAAQKPGNGGGTNEPPLNAPMPQGGTTGGGISPQTLNLVLMDFAARDIATRSLGSGSLPAIGQCTPPVMLRGSIGFGDTVTSDDVARGWRVAYTTNDWEHSYEMPQQGASYVGKWHIHGGHRNIGLMRIGLGDLSFPFGSGDDVHSALWYTLDGRLRTTPLGTEGEISCVGAGMFAAPGVGRMWTAAGENGSRIVTWEDFYIAGDETNELVCAQIELFPNGNFVMRSNEVATVCERIDPSDWDGDGLANEIDDQPMQNGGDLFGTGMDWLNANCGGVLSAVPTAGGGYEIVWNTNANENAYYWLSFTPTHDGTRVSITCDGPSNLGDMVVIANEGQVCEVPLLIGPRYIVAANWPVDDIWASDPEAEIMLNTVQPTMLSQPGLRLLGAGGGATLGPSDLFGVERPVDLNLGGGEGGGSLASNPDVGATINAVEGYCCSVDCSASNYVWSCSGDCHCAGYSQWWQVTATWEGYSRWFYWEGQCECQRERETNSVEWVSLSCPDVIMRGGNSHYVSGVFDPPSSSGATASMSLECTAGAEKITVLSQGAGWMEIQGAATSDSVGDVEFRLVSGIGDNAYTNTARLTVACVDRLEMSCAYSGQSVNPPPFDGETECPFSVTNSIAPERHLVVPFGSVATLGDSGFSVRDFTVDMNLVLSPAGANGSNLPCDWEVVEAIPQMSGSLSHSSGLMARFVNPKQGGVYRLRGRCDGCPWTEGNVVLPLSGAEVSSVFENDMVNAARVIDGLPEMSNLRKHWPPTILQLFENHQRGTYAGRVDNAAGRTVRVYNPVVPGTGRGGAATLYGVTIEMDLLSAFVQAFGMERLGVAGIAQSAEHSWIGRVGENLDYARTKGQLASSSSNVTEIARDMCKSLWPESSASTRQLWPNVRNCDNHEANPPELPQILDYENWFKSPGYIYRQYDNL